MMAPVVVDVCRAFLSFSDVLMGACLVVQKVLNLMVFRVSMWAPMGIML
jgi:hypothetical protein